MRVFRSRLSAFSSLTKDHFLNVTNGYFIQQGEKLNFEFQVIRNPDEANYMQNIKIEVPSFNRIADVQELFAEQVIHSHIC